MIRIATAPPVGATNPFVVDFHKARLALLMNLAAMEDLPFDDIHGSTHLYGSYEPGALEIRVPMTTEKEKFKLNHFLGAVMELRLLDALNFHYESGHEREWVLSFLEQYWSLEYPRLAPVES